MSYYNDPYSQQNRPQMGSGKVEEELAQHIKKALSTEESAPKQKHVRALIVYTWDLKSSGSLWNGLKVHPIIGDEVVTFKALISIHKVIREGHPSVLRDAVREQNWIESLARSIPPHGRGYGVLIRAYSQFLLTKINYHRTHPEFTGTFDYDEYVTLKGIEDPNEGFETINDLLGLLDKLDSFQKLIFNNFLASTTNEARIAALVPLVEESYGIYQFLVSMLTAMHQVVGSQDVLAPLREKFKSCHYALFRFYYECSTLRYLTSLISVPKLSQDAPNFLDSFAPNLPPRGPRTPTPPTSPRIDIQAEQEAAARLEQQLLEQQRLEQQRLEEQRAAQQLLEQQRYQQQLFEQQQQQQLLQRQMEADNLRNQMGAQFQSQLEIFRQQAARDRETIDNYAQRMRALENQLQNLSMSNNAADNAKEDTIRRLQEELTQWKAKYEALAKLYAQLRKEHLDLLNKFKELKDSGGKIAEEARREVEKARAELRQKQNEMTEVLVDRERTKGEVDRVRRQYEDEMARLRRDVAESKDQVADINTAKQAEIAALSARFSHEKNELDLQLRTKQQQVEEMRKRLEDITNEMLHVKTSSDENAYVNQAAMDQALLTMQQIQKSAQENEAALRLELNKLQAGHVAQMNKMIDNILGACMVKIDEAVYELESTATEGNTTATPEYVLSLLEKVGNTCHDFTSAFVKLVQGGDQADAITQSNSLANGIAQLLHNAKGLTRNTTDDAAIDRLVSVVKAGALGGRAFFEQLQSPSLSRVEPVYRPDYIQNLSRDAYTKLNAMAPALESLAPKEVVAITASTTEDIGEVVEREMLNAARAVDAAARKLQELLSRPLNVHSSIIEAAAAITNTIAELIRCATHSQQEIVAQSRGASTKGAFYKKNNKWTEGLISAAKAVAVATTYLVECADGFLSGTHSTEQLVVAAQEVNVATTQLVAASRVKAIPFSKTQDRLEEAAVAVREATKALVRAVKEQAKRAAEQSVDSEIRNMSRHEFKVREMEQQVKILELEKELQNARYKLGEIRKAGYQEE